MRIRSLSVALLLTAAGCHSWRTQPGPAPDAVARLNGGGTIRVLRRDHSTVELRNPQVVGDSIVGLFGDPPVRATVAVADVERIDARRVNAAKTGGLAVGTFVIGTIVAAAALTVALLASWN